MHGYETDLCETLLRYIIISCKKTEDLNIENIKFILFEFFDNDAIEESIKRVLDKSNNPKCINKLKNNNVGNLCLVVTRKQKEN